MQLLHPELFEQLKQFRVHELCFGTKQHKDDGWMTIFNVIMAIYLIALGSPIEDVGFYGDIERSSRI